MSFNPPPNPATWNAQTTHPTHGQGDSPNQSRSTTGTMPILSREEIIAIKECNSESFYYRCVPLSTLFSGLAYIGMKNGLLQKSQRLGYFPKMFIGALIGYIGGKISYQSKCEEKIMKLPNSNLGAALRKRKGLQTFEESVNTEPGFSYKSPSSFDKEKLIVDERRPDFSEHEEGLDSYNAVKESLSPYSENENASKQQKYSSYDELRRENREEYFNKLTEKYKKSIPDRSPPPPNFPGGYGYSDSSDLDRRYSDDSSTRPESGSDTKREPYFNPKRNKYGDLWDD